MVQISRFKPKDSVMEKISQLFFEVVGKNESQNEFNMIIGDILSNTERIMIGKRIAIIYLLNKNIDYVTICDILKVSGATVAKFKLLMAKSDELLPSLKKIIKNEKIKDFMEELLLFFRGSGVPGVDWSDAKRREKELERKRTEGI